MSTLAGRTIVMSGGSRGIGKQIALRAASDGANVVMLAKTDTPHPTLPGTVHEAIEEIEQVGGHGLAVVGDVRVDADVERAVAAAVETFGGIDVVINNASAIDLSPTAGVPMKKFDLMHSINVRASFLLAKTAFPHLVRSEAAHVLTLSPPIRLEPRWHSAHLAYTLSKFGMSLVTLGLAAEWREHGILATSLWPRTNIDTAAVRHIVGPESAARSRSPQVMADAAHAILTRADDAWSGQCLIDEDVLRSVGVNDFEQYRAVPGDGELDLDLWVDAGDPSTVPTTRGALA